MKTLVVVGAGEQLGLSVARKFGHQGFEVALISREAGKLEGLAEELAGSGVTATTYPADVTDRPGLQTVLAEIERRQGRIEVLDYAVSPDFRDPATPFEHALDVTVDNLEPHLDLHVRGLITAVRQVLPGMRTAGRGSILVSAGGSAIDPVPFMGNIGLATAAMRHWTLNLNQSVQGSGVHVAFIAISGLIGVGGPQAQPDIIADFVWAAYTGRERAEYRYQIPVGDETRAALGRMLTEAALLREHRDG